MWILCFVQTHIPLGAVHILDVASGPPLTRTESFVQGANQRVRISRLHHSTALHRLWREGTPPLSNIYVSYWRRLTLTICFPTSRNCWNTFADSVSLVYSIPFSWKTRKIKGILLPRGHKLIKTNHKSIFASNTLRQREGLHSLQRVNHFVQRALRNPLRHP